MASAPPPDRDSVEAARRNSPTGLGWIRARMARAGLTRAGDGLIAGVLAGLAHRFGLSPWILRVAFLVSVLLPGPQFLLYLVLWIAMPRSA